MVNVRPLREFPTTRWIRTQRCDDVTVATSLVKTPHKLQVTVVYGVSHRNDRTSLTPVLVQPLDHLQVTLIRSRIHCTVSAPFRPVLMELFHYTQMVI
jgi:hypothetical protein